MAASKDKTSECSVVLCVVRLSSQPIWGHPSLASHFIGSHLKTRHISSFTQHLLIKFPRLRLRFFGPECGPFNASFLSLATQSKDGRQDLYIKRDSVSHKTHSISFTCKSPKFNLTMFLFCSSWRSRVTKRSFSPIPNCLQASRKTLMFSIC